MAAEAGRRAGAVAALVVAVSASATHAFSKACLPRIELLAGLGVQGDAHAGVTVRHRSRVARDPAQPNLRQVHLLPVELLGRLAANGFHIAAGEFGENIMTSGVDLTGLPTGTELHIGAHAVVRLTGLRNPCPQIEQFRKGLLAEVRHRRPDGSIERLAGVMSVVAVSGCVCAGDAIRVVLPDTPHVALQPV
ncbi:MAG: MOSC domain-containing protein [Pseudomonadales bacterium]